MTYPPRTSAVALGLVFLSLLCSPSVTGQVTHRLIPFPEWASSYDEDEEVPLELIDISISGRRITLGQPFVADGDWLKSMTLRVKNVGAKPIRAFSVGGGLLRGTDEELPSFASFQYGISWHWGKESRRTKRKPNEPVLVPGESIDVTYANVSDLTRTVLAKEGEEAFCKLEFMLPGVQYSDGTDASMPMMRFYGTASPTTVPPPN